MGKYVETTLDDPYQQKIRVIHRVVENQAQEHSILAACSAVDLPLDAQG